MSKFKKALSLILVIALTAGIAISGTLAYLTDRDSKANVFTVGDVSIRLDEDFEQGATLIPGVKIEKEPTITNVGNNEAWVWATVAIPAALDNDDASKNVIHFNMSKDSIAEGLWSWTDSDEYRVSTEKIDNVNYNVYTVLYQTALKPGDTTAEPVIYQVYMDYHVDIDPDGNLHHVENSGVEDIDWNINEDGNPIIYVSAYAIQKEGYNTVEEAYDGYKKQWGDNGSEYATTVLCVDEAYYQNLTANEDYTVDGEGKTVVGIASSVDAFQWSDDGTIPAMSTIFSSAGKSGAKATVKDITFTGTMSSVMAGQYAGQKSDWYKTEFNNVNIVDAEVVSFSASISPALTVYGNMTMNDCKVTGTTLSELDTDPMWTVYDVALVNSSVTVMNDCEIGSINFWAKAKLTLNDTTVDTIVVRGDMNKDSNYGIYICAGSTVGTIDLSAVTDSSKVNITIAEGGSVGTFVDNGVSYDSIAEWKDAQ